MVEVMLEPTIIGPIVITLLEAGFSAWRWPRSRSWQEAFVNISMFWLGHLVNTYLVVGLVMGFLRFAEMFRFWRLPENLLMSLLCFILVDFLYYWRHRIQHAVPLFWADHSGHHSSPELGFSTALRLPWGMLIYGWIAFVPAVLLGFSADLVYGCFIISLFYQVWIHHDKIPELPWLEWIFNTPHLHRVHHGKDAADHNRNFAGILVLWDRLFKTYKVGEVKEFGVDYRVNSINPLWVQIVPYKLLIRRFLKRIKSSATPTVN